jgi:hypothetical protein
MAGITIFFLPQFLTLIWATSPFCICMKIDFIEIKSVAQKQNKKREHGCYFEPVRHKISAKCF